MIIHSFIVLATVITIVNYDRKTFIVQATGWNRQSFYNRATITVEKSFIVKAKLFNPWQL